jgi:hypothetical protein
MGSLYKHLDIAAPFGQHSQRSLEFMQFDFRRIKYLDAVHLSRLLLSIYSSLGAYERVAAVKDKRVSYPLFSWLNSSESIVVKILGARFTLTAHLEGQLEWIMSLSPFHLFLSLVL